MQVRPPETEFLTVVEDSRRWEHVTLRGDDVVIATPPKCGTTWMQGIVASLLWKDGDAPEERPWVDFRVDPIEELLSTLEALEHRRVIKSHCPLSALPIGCGVRYLLVYRNPADALVSWGNHREKMIPEVMNAANQAAAADGLAALPERFDGDYNRLFEEWSHYWSPARHLALSLDLRCEPNVMFFHYADLYEDLAEQMRRLARFLEVPIDEPAFGEQIRRCHIDEMREAARSRGGGAFTGGVDSFYYRGGNGRGKELLTKELLTRVEQHTRELLGADVAKWLTSGGEFPA